MSYFKTNNIIGSFELSGFEGIDRSSPAANGKCTDMVNLRILPDRSVVKRDGYRECFDLTEKIRAVYSGSFEGAFAVFALAGDTLYKLNMSSGEKSIIGHIYTNEGPVSIFCYMGVIYVIDGSDIFEVRDGKLAFTEGYVPLIGKEWGNNYPGELYEPLNALTPKGRITYIVDETETSFMSTYYLPKTVDAVYVNGELRDPSTYAIDSRLRAVNVTGLHEGDRVAIYCTFDVSQNEKERLRKNSRAMVFGGINNSRVFMWGGEEKNRMFVSTPVSHSAVEEAEIVYGNSGGLYFPIGNDFCVGDGKHEIRAVSRHYDRLLIFTSGDTWMADSEVSSSQSFPMTRINTDVGCASMYGVAKCGNDPISVGHSAIYRWTSNTDTLEDCNAYVISDRIKELLGADFFDYAVVFTDRHKGEVLFAHQTALTNRIFVYSIHCNEWYMYDGVAVDHFFEGEKSLGFASGSKICLFESGRVSDRLLNGTEKSISSYCAYSANGFGHPTRTKRIAGIMGVGELKSGELRIELESERGKINSVSFTAEDPWHVECFYKRMRGERFKNSRIRISTDTAVQQRIYSLTVTVRP